MPKVGYQIKVQDGALEGEEGSPALTGVFACGTRTVSPNLSAKDTLSVAPATKALAPGKGNGPMVPSVAAHLAAITLHPHTLGGIMGLSLACSGTTSNGLI